MAFNFFSLRRWASSSSKENSKLTTARQQLPERELINMDVSYLNGNTDVPMKLEQAKADALKQARKSTAPVFKNQTDNSIMPMQADGNGLAGAMSHIKDKLQPNINLHSEIPIAMADNTPLYRGIHQQPTIATTAIRSTPSLVYHHPRRTHSQTSTTSHPQSLAHPPHPTTYIHHSSPLALSLLTQLKSFLLLPPTTPTHTLLLNLLTKHNKVRLDLPGRKAFLAAWIDRINWYGVHKHSSLSKTEKWVLELFTKSQRGLFERGVEGYDLSAIAARLGETKKIPGGGGKSLEPFRKNKRGRQWLEWR